MKKLSLILAILMVNMCMLMASVTTVSAESGFFPTAEDKAAIEAGKYFKVGTEYFSTYNSAFQKAKVAGNVNEIDIISNVTISSSARWTEGNPGQNMVIDGNGFTVTFTANSNDYGWKIDSNQNYTVAVKDVTFNTVGRFQFKGNVSLDNVTVVSTTAHQNYGAIMLQAATHLTMNNCKVSSNPTHPSNTAESNDDAVNPVFKLNGTNDVVVDIKGETVINSYNSFFCGYGANGNSHSNVVFNIYDGVTIKAMNPKSVLFNCQWTDIGINIFGGKLEASDAVAAIRINDGNGHGSYVNLYGGKINGNVLHDKRYSSFNVYKGDFTLNGVEYKTDDFAHVKGASIRHTDGTAGIRFESILPKSVYDSVVAGAVEGSVRVGTILMPYEYFTYAKDGLFTKESIAELQYLDIVAKNSLSSTDANGNYRIKAAMINITDKNLGRDFIATGYISWKDSQGNSWTVYSNLTPSEDDARNIREIAWAALKDTVDNKESIPTSWGVNPTIYEVTTYANTVNFLIENGEARYSRYSQKAMENIARFVK